MEIIDRYVYAVVSRLPQAKRQDIERELRSVIDDMMESYGGATEENARRAIEELGDPAKLAEKYADKPKYLISPRVYDSYFLVLRIVLIAVVFGMTVAAIVGAALGGAQLPDAIGKYIGSLITGLVFGFAWVTLIFFVVDRYNVKMDFKGADKPWTAGDLKEIPSQKAVISRGDCIASIVVSSVFMVIIAIVPTFAAAYIPIGGEGGVHIVSLFDMNVLASRLWMFFAIYIVSILRDSVKLIAGRWSAGLGIFSAAAGAVTTLFAIAIFSDFTIWNQSFGVQVAQMVNLPMFVMLWTVIMHVVLWIIIIAGIGGAISELYKGFRYGGTRQDELA